MFFVRCFFIFLVFCFFSCKPKQLEEPSQMFVHGFSSIKGLLTFTIHSIDNLENHLLFLFLSEEEFTNVVFSHLPEAKATNGPTGKEMYSFMIKEAKRDFFNLRHLLENANWDVHRIYSPKKTELYGDIIFYKNVTIELKNLQTGRIRIFPSLLKTIVRHKDYYRLIAIDLN